MAKKKEKAFNKNDIINIDKLKVVITDLVGVLKKHKLGKIEIYYVVDEFHKIVQIERREHEKMAGMRALFEMAHNLKEKIDKAKKKNGKHR